MMRGLSAMSGSGRAGRHYNPLIFLMLHYGKPFVVHCTKKVLTPGAGVPTMRFVRCSKTREDPSPGRRHPSPRSTRPLTFEGIAMYNATEQFAELNKANVE